MVGRLDRTGQLALLLLGLGAIALLGAVWWPRRGPVLDCAPESLRWVDTASGPIARCEGQAPATARPLTGGAALTLGGKLNLNRATEQDLTLASGVGSKLAQALVRERDASGGFRSWDEVDRVPGIGAAKLAALRAVADIGP